MTARTITLLKAPGPIGKAFALDAEGRVTSRSVPGLGQAEATCHVLPGLAELGGLLDALTPDHALMLGVTEHAQCNVLSRDALARYAGRVPAISRDKQHVRWPAGAGLMLLDVDAQPGAEPLTPDDLVETLRDAVPELRTVTLLHRASSSSWVFRDDGTPVRALRGQHLYLIVDDAVRIPEVGKLIEARLWLAGLGRVDVGAAGQLLERTTVDGSVWSPERLVFAAAHVGPGLEVRRPPACVFHSLQDEGLALETSLDPGAMAPLTEAEWRRVAELKAAARKAASPASRVARDAWASARVAHLAEEAREAAKAELMQSVENQELPLSLELLSEDGQLVTVADLMADREHWNGRRFADPLEPDYRGDPRIAVAQLVNVPNPRLFSHAHGGVRYLLQRPCVFEDLTKVEPGEPGRFRALTVAEMMNRPKPRWWIRGVVPQAEIGMVYGASGAGKSFAVLDLCGAIARGVSWAGREVTQAAVVYVAAEGAGGFGQRLTGYVARHTLDPTRLPLRVIPAAPNLWMGEDWRALAHALPAGTKLVFIDTLAQCAPGADENTAKDMGRVLANALALGREAGVMVILVHHAGKNADAGARGWSGLWGAMDAVLEVSQQGDRRQLKVAKLKDGRGQGDTYSFTLVPVADWDGHEDDVDRPVVAEFSAGTAGGIPPARTRRPGAAEAALLGALASCPNLANSPGGSVRCSHEQSVWIIDRAVEGLPPPDHGARDRRRDTVRRALDELQRRGGVVIEGAGV